MLPTLKLKNSKMTRRDLRQRLFQLNRQYIAQLNMQEDREFLTADFSQTNSDSEDDYVDPQYSLVISTFKGEIRKPHELMELIRKLRCDHIFGTYQAIMGIYSLGCNLFTHDNEIEVLGSGVVPVLSNLLFKTQHPYLQLRAANILLRLMNRVGTDRFLVFFNRQLIPYQALLVFMDSQLVYLNQNGLKMMRILLRNKYPIEANDSNRDLLYIIERLVQKWRDDKGGLQLVFNVMEKFEVYYWEGRIQFAEKFFSIIVKIIENEVRSSTRSEVLRDILFWATGKVLVKRICNLFFESLENVEKSYPNTVNFITTLYGFKLHSQCIQVDWWKYFIHALINNKQGQGLLYSLNILQKIQHQILNQQENRPIQAVIIEVFGKLLNCATSGTIEDMVENKLVLSKMAELYGKANKNMVKSLNWVVVCILRAANLCDSAQILLENNLLHGYISMSGSFDRQTAKVSMKTLKGELERMERTENLRSQYDQLISFLLQEKYFSMITSMLHHNYCTGAEQILKYYQDIKFSKNFKSYIYFLAAEGSSVEAAMEACKEGENCGQVATRFLDVQQMLE